MRERVMAVSFLLVTKWSLIVYVCVHMGVGGGRKTERKREGKRERLSPCNLGTGDRHASLGSQWQGFITVFFMSSHCQCKPTHKKTQTQLTQHYFQTNLLRPHTDSDWEWNNTMSDMRKITLERNKHTTNSTALFPFNIPLKSSTSRLNLYYITSMHYFYENVLNMFLLVYMLCTVGVRTVKLQVKMRFLDIFFLITYF